MIRTIVMLAVLTLTASLLSGAQTPSKRVMTVCEVLSRLSAFRGDRRPIEVRGQWDGSLSDDCPKLQTESYTWPNAIWVVLPSYPAPMVDQEFPIDWETTFDGSVYSAALRGAWAEWERLPAGQKEKMAVMATITGRLDVRANTLSVRGGLPYGYGLQAAFPAQLVVVGIKDIALAPVQKRIAIPPSNLQRNRE